MVDSNKKNNIFFLILFSFLLFSILATYYRYIIRQDFQYFVTEDETHSQFDINTYTK